MLTVRKKKMKKGIKKIIINFNKINKKCDSEYKKLYDKMHNLKLSHNRKTKLLCKIQEKLKEVKKNKTDFNPIGWFENQNPKIIAQLIDEIEIELNSMLRVKSKPIIIPKTNKLTIEKEKIQKKPKPSKQLDLIDYLENKK